MAITYYAVALAVAAASWPWGVAMLCLPFLCFALVGLSHAVNRRANLITITVAGAVMLIMSAVGLGTDGYRPKAAPSEPMSLAAAVVDATATPKPVSTPSAGPSAIAASISVAPAINTPSVAVIDTPSRDATAPVTDATTIAPSVTTLAATRTDQPIASVYVASKNGKVFHLPKCSSAKNIKPENRLEFASREKAVEKGLNPCKRCKP